MKEESYFSEESKRKRYQEHFLKLKNNMDLMQDCNPYKKHLTEELDYRSQYDRSNNDLDGMIASTLFFLLYAEQGLAWEEGFRKGLVSTSGYIL